MLATFLLMIGRLLIPISTTFICYLAIAYGTNTSEISGLVAPLVLCFLLSYWIACMFLEIFGMGIETILFCFIADEEMFTVEKRYVILVCAVLSHIMQISVSIKPGLVYCLSMSITSYPVLILPDHFTRFASGELMTTIQQTAQQAASLKITPEGNAKEVRVVQVTLRLLLCYGICI